jgi:ferredoxin
MPKVTFLRRDGSVIGEKMVEDGENLRYAALDYDKDVPIYCHLFKLANCHGNGLCGTDRVMVSPATAVNPRTVAERIHLRKKPNLRLSCQVEIHGDCTVTTMCGRR